MLGKILSSDIAMKIMFHLYHCGEVYPSVVSNAHKISLSGVQRQFQRFEETGLLVSKLVDRKRVYIFNKKCPVTKSFIEVVKFYYNEQTLAQKKKILSPMLKNKKPDLKTHK
jgi:hypothetical protein